LPRSRRAAAGFAFNRPAVTFTRPLRPSAGR